MTNDDKALVERLMQENRVVTIIGDPDENGHRFITSGPHIQHEAAFRIEELSAENERLRELLNRVADETDHDCETMWITDIIRAALGE